MSVTPATKSLLCIWHLNMHVVFTNMISRFGLTSESWARVPAHDWICIFFYKFLWVEYVFRLEPHGKPVGLARERAYIWICITIWSNTYRSVFIYLLYMWYQNLHLRCFRELYIIIWTLTWQLGFWVKWLGLTISASYHADIMLYIL